MLDSVLFAQIQHKFLLHLAINQHGRRIQFSHVTDLPYRLVGLELNVLDSSIHHERKEVEDKVRILPQTNERSVAE